MSRPTLALAGALCLAAATTHAAEDPAFGYWLTESGNAIVEIEPCDAGACGNIVWLAEPNDQSGQPKRDVRNEDASKHDRRICGLAMIGDFTQEGPGEWDGGFIYNPEDGKTYTSLMEAQGDGTLRVKGYVGIPLFGKSQLWTRQDGDRGGC